ncbi:MAG TPA: penicillin-binding protein 2 [Acidocella sp.]|nr:MAG: penicillin-binding protein 2 [Acidocella sp. 20-58-15]HQT38645.1 penicillin-binding protein 2 [Acidocella sp.]
MKRDTKKQPGFTKRALLIGTAQAAIFGAIGTRLYKLQVDEHSKYQLLAEHNSISERLTAPERGLITDRFGVVLAGNQQHWRALFMAAQAPDAASVLDNFAKLVPLDADERARIATDISGRPGYIPVLLKDYLEWPEMAALEVNTPNLPGVIVEVGTSRVYPFGASFAHPVGYVARPDQAEAKANNVLALPGMRVGRSGAEAANDDVLRGSPGYVQTETNVHGEIVRQVAHDNGIPGQTVALSLDVGMQNLAVQALGTQAGAAVVLDALTGEILAMASNPGFDPGLFDKGIPADVWKGWMADPMHPLQNKAIAGLFAPGSTFKPTVALAALKYGSLTPEKILTCNGSFQLGDHVFWCDNHIAHGSITLTTALQVSCDVFFYQVALGVGVDRIAEMAHTLGIGVDLQLDIPHASPGLVPTIEWAAARGVHWAPGNTVVQGIGQGYTQVTPMALATMIARVATGIEVGPHMARRIDGNLQDGSDVGDWPALDVDDRHLAVVRQALFEVVNTPSGTAYGSRLDLPNVQMAGKTGTAQVHDNTAAEKQKNFNDATMAWADRPNGLFVGFAPYDAPRYAVAVIVEHGLFGAQVAAPIAKQLMTYALTNDPAGRDVPLNTKVSDAGIPS